MGKAGSTFLVWVALCVTGCKGENYPAVRGHNIGDNAQATIEKLVAANFRSRIAWDGSLLLGEGQEKDCNKLFDLPGQGTPCQSMRLQFTFPLVGSGSPFAREESELYSVEYFQRFENPVAASVWLSEVNKHFGELQEVNYHQNTVQELESRRYVRVLSGPYQARELDILKETEVAKAEMASGCKRPIAMARANENRRQGMTLSYQVEVVDVQRLCKLALEIEKMRAAKGGPADQIKFK